MAALEYEPSLSQQPVADLRRALNTFLALVSPYPKCGHAMCLVAWEVLGRMLGTPVIARGRCSNCRNDADFYCHTHSADVPRKNGDS
jgi:hypothetical protein